MSQPFAGCLRRPRLYPLLMALLLFLVSAGCNVSVPDQRPPAAPRSDYLLTIALEPGETRAAVAQRYGGHIVVWEGGAFAVIGLQDTLASQSILDDATALTAEESRDAFLAGGRPAWMSGTSKLWSGGTSKLWSGGDAEMWTSGTSKLWSGGEYAWMPENTAVWRQVRLQQGQALAPNLGYGVKVAVIDTGLDLDHPALREALAPAAQWYDFYADDALPQEEGTLAKDGYGHGTNVAGIIRQVAPRATILPIRVLGPDGYGDADDLAAAIHWAVTKGARIVNLSLGGDREIGAVDKVIEWATAQGVFVVASTGNTGDSRVTYPASKSSGSFRTSVTSVDLADSKSRFATYGKPVELAGPGENIHGPAPDLRMAAWTGTSQAAPLASAALALALGETLAVPRSELGDKLGVHAANLYVNGKNRQFEGGIGHGRLDLKMFLGSVVK